MAAHLTEIYRDVAAGPRSMTRTRSNVRATARPAAMDASLGILTLTPSMAEAIRNRLSLVPPTPPVRRQHFKAGHKLRVMMPTCGNGRPSGSVLEGFERLKVAAGTTDPSGHWRVMSVNPAGLVDARSTASPPTLGCNRLPSGWQAGKTWSDADAARLRAASWGMRIGLGRSPSPGSHWCR